MTYNYLSRKGTFIAFLATVVFILIVIVPIILGLEAFDAVPQERQAYAEEGNIFQIGLMLAVILLAVGIIAAILFSLFQVASNPKGAMKGLLAFGAVIVLFFILYAMASGTGTGSLVETIEKFGISESVVKMVGAGISLTLTLGGVAIFSMVAMEIWNYFKNQ
jgi:hypothetical protein